MSKLSTAWTGAVAYVSLLTGSGLSVAGNVADTFRTRGEATDGLDIILAGAWPILVILTIEMFVSRRWAPSRGFQTLRWFGCLAIGNLAMLVSWLHLHDLMASRGQLPLVAMAGPLAIDGMAIMATGLILSTRGRVATPDTKTTGGHGLNLFTSTPGAVPAVVHAPSAYVPVTQEDLDDRMDSADMWARLTDEMDSSVAPVSAVPVSPAPRSNEVKPESVPADAADLILAWTQADPATRPSAGDVDMLLAAEFDRQPRTIRRWRDALKG
jgi:hypothetical protein